MCLGIDEDLKAQVNGIDLECWWIPDWLYGQSKWEVWRVQDRDDEML